MGRGSIALALFYFMYIKKLADAIYNDVVSGLQGYHHNPSISMEQLEDDVVDERLQIISEYIHKGTLPFKDLLIAINCIPVDCKDLEKCRCRETTGTPMAHFEIPQTINGIRSIDYIGSIDKQLPFMFYTSIYQKDFYHKYRKRGKDKPYVWIDTTPNENGMYDGYIFNAPMIKQISVVAIFKDPRQLEDYSCCSDLDDDNYSALNNEIKRRLTEKKLRYYRQLAMQPQPNDQTYKP